MNPLALEAGSNEARRSDLGPLRALVCRPSIFAVRANYFDSTHHDDTLAQTMPRPEPVVAATQPRTAAQERDFGRVQPFSVCRLAAALYARIARGAGGAGSADFTHLHAHRARLGAVRARIGAAARSEISAPTHMRRPAYRPCHGAHRPRRWPSASRSSATHIAGRFLRAKAATTADRLRPGASARAHTIFIRLRPIITNRRTAAMLECVSNVRTPPFTTK